MHVPIRIAVTSFEVIIPPSLRTRNNNGVMHPACRLSAGLTTRTPKDSATVKKPRQRGRRGFIEIERITRRYSALAAVHRIFSAVRNRIDVRRSTMNGVAGSRGKGRRDKRSRHELLNHQDTPLLMSV